MVLFAIFMCLAHPQAYVGSNCIFLTDHSVYGGGQYVSAGQCRRDLAYFEHGKLPGYVNVCMQKTVPDWGPAE